MPGGGDSKPADQNYRQSDDCPDSVVPRPGTMPRICRTGQYLEGSKIPRSPCGRFPWTEACWRASGPARGDRLRAIMLLLCSQRRRLAMICLSWESTLLYWVHVGVTSCGLELCATVAPEECPQIGESATTLPSGLFPSRRRSRRKARANST
jgi:hypothetical protein